MSDLGELLKKAVMKNPEKGQKFIDGLTNSAKREMELNKLTNREISKQLMTKVWAEMDLWTEESDLVEQAIDRLNKS